MQRQKRGMSDWLYRNPGQSGWFKTYPLPWEDPTNGTYHSSLPSGGWFGTYHPHWQHPQKPEHVPAGNCANAADRFLPATWDEGVRIHRHHRAYARCVPHQAYFLYRRGTWWQVAITVSFVAMPYLWHFDKMWPSLARSLGF